MVPNAETKRAFGNAETGLDTLVLSTSRLETSREESSNRLVSGEEWARIVEKFLGLARMVRAGSSL